MIAFLGRDDDGEKRSSCVPGRRNGDSCDADLAMLAWQARDRGKSVLARGLMGGKRCFLHRVIADRAGIGGPEVDHVNCDGLDNRRANLRAATRLQNSRNVRCRADSRSGLKGVSWYERIGRWQARIKVDRKEKYLGSFATAEEAHAAYAKASLTFHGEFGRAQ
jgi:hypothetical protein